MRNFKRIFLSVAALLMSLIVIMGMTPNESGKIAVETVVLSPGNTAPIAENIELYTFKDTVIAGTFKAYDAENEHILFEITKLPKHGEVTVYEDGSFLYDPCGTRKGNVTFTYVAVDASGNRSKEAAVTVKIEKQTGDVFYIDMHKDEGEYAALYLSENGIYTGECICGAYFFKPEREVTKAEFLTMCLKATDREILTGVVRTGLKNDKELPSWVKNSVSTAVLCGGFIYEDVFNYNESITYEEAVMMINDIFEITDVVSASAISPYLRDESSQAMNNLYSCNITDENIVSKFDEYLTMRDAAKMLTSAMEVYNNR